MLRTTLIGVFLVAVGLIASRSALRAQDELDGPPRRLSIGERLDRFRRNLMGQPDEELLETYETPQRNRPAERAPAAGRRGSNQPAPVRRVADRHAPQTSRRPGAPAASTAAPNPAATSEDAPAEERTQDEQTPTASHSTTGKGRPNPADIDAALNAIYQSGKAKTPSPRPAVTSAPISPPAEAAAPGRTDPGLPGRPTRGEQATSRPDAASPAVQASAGALFVGRGPALVVETNGPGRIKVGQPATYEISLTNAADVTAADVELIVSLPLWASVEQASASAGRAGQGDEDGQFQWLVDSLPAHGREKLLLQIAPQEGRPFNLAVRWSSAAATSQATIEVHEPKLELDIAGPGHVVCGSKEIYRLSVGNPGSGDADNVVLHLLPIDSEQAEPTSHPIGPIAAGENKVVEIELTVRQGGPLTIRAEATADGDLKATAAADVMVSQPELRLTLSGPPKQYAGTTATYEIQVENSGNAPAQNVSIVARLPAQAEYVASSEGGQAEQDGTQVTWTIESLPAGGERILAMKCLLKAAGENRLQVAATGDGELAQSESIATEAQAVADLVLEVADPPGPIPVGDDMTYEVRVRNRGTKSAEGIDIRAYFSDGIEPVAVAGGPHDIAPGTVTFQSLPSLTPGREVRFKVTARAATSGSHRFRVELECKASGTRLSQEETTLFYGDSASADSTNASGTGSAAGPQLPAEPPANARRATTGARGAPRRK